jgi:hypothetical protein
MPEMEDEDSEVLTLQVSIDGLIWSRLEPMHYTTLSQVSFLPVPYPKLQGFSPTAFLRADTHTYTVEILGENLDKLVNCTGIL